MNAEKIQNSNKIENGGGWVNKKIKPVFVLLRVGLIMKEEAKLYT